MSLKKLSVFSIMAASLMGCGGGDINIAPSTPNAPGGGGGTPSNPITGICAFYTDLDGTVREGTWNGTDCRYDVAFVDIDNPLEVDLNIPSLASGGVHIFDGSLVVGVTYSSDTDLAAAGITQGGDGPTLTLARGTTLAFGDSDDFILINRGSQIIANGTVAEPITLTSQTDAVLGTVGPEDVQQWGGIVINGFGVTNKCDYTGTRGIDLALSGECHVVAEGKASAGESNYGGNNDADNSGVLRYVVSKYSGAEVGPGNELNGISFNAVGSGTTVENLEIYSTYDDGLEFFGGAVNVTNYIGLYVRDDSLDIDEGYRGTITNALIIQQRFDGNHCIESDGIGSYDGLGAGVADDFVARGLNSAATINNITCIISANQTGTHDPGAGFLIREAHIPTISNALVTTAYSGDDLLGDPEYNYCVFIDDAQGEAAAAAGTLVLEDSIISCTDLAIGENIGGSAPDVWLGTQVVTYTVAEAGEDPTATSNPALQILDGYFSLPLGSETPAAPGTTSGTLGAVEASNDWTSGWAFGLEPGNRAQPLWFE